jgi:hypothetical protein
MAAHWNYGSSVRIPFPNSLSVSSSCNRIQQLTAKVRGLVQTKVKAPINRLGLCATHFEARESTGSITAFFGGSSSTKTTTPTQNESQQVGFETITDAINVKINGDMSTISKKDEPWTHGASSDTLDNDAEYARQLQASFDRENTILTSVEHLHGRNKQHSTRAVDRQIAAQGRIDSFFSMTNIQKLKR